MLLPDLVQVNFGLLNGHIDQRGQRVISDLTVPDLTSRTGGFANSDLRCSAVQFFGDDGFARGDAALLSTGHGHAGPGGWGRTPGRASSPAGRRVTGCVSAICRQVDLL